MSERPTLKTIAKMTGLAVTTVSKALNDAPDIAKATRLRVREAADGVGYRPDRTALRLRTGKTNVISLSICTEEYVMNHTTQLIYSISASLRGTPYHLNITPWAQGDDPMEPVRYVVETGAADGIIINRTSADDPRVKYMTAKGFPFATHGRTDLGLNHPYVDFDSLKFGRLCVDALVSRGRKNLALLAPPFGEYYHRLIVEGFVGRARELGISHKIMQCATTDGSFEQVREAITAATAKENAPDGFAVSSTSATIAVAAGCEQSHLKIGRDLDIVAKDAGNFLKLFRANIVIVPDEAQTAGSLLVKAVLRAIDDKSAPPVQHIISPLGPA